MAAYEWKAEFEKKFNGMNSEIYIYNFKSKIIHKRVLFHEYSTESKLNGQLKTCIQNA